METNRVAWILAACMCAAAVGGIAARPNVKAADRGQSISLEAIVPKQFGDWRLLENQGAQVVNPQTQELLDKIYSQILSRTYVNSQGYRVMLSLAYGDDQRGALQAHKPEVCYPAQGFKLHSNEPGSVSTRFGPIPARRLNTSLGARQEPVTYWFAMGDTTVMNAMEKRWLEIRLALTGQIPDGMLFRVSSIDGDAGRAFGQQDRFVNELLKAVGDADRMRLSGLRGATDS